MFRMYILCMMKHFPQFYVPEDAEAQRRSFAYGNVHLAAAPLGSVTNGARGETVKIVLTAAEIISAYRWRQFCEARGVNEWAIAEGLMDSDHEFTLAMDEVNAIGLGDSIRAAIDDEVSR